MNDNASLMELNKKKQIALIWISNNITCDEVIFSEAFTRLKEIFKEIREIKLKQKVEVKKDTNETIQQALKVFRGEEVKLK